MKLKSFIKAILLITCVIFSLSSFRNFTTAEKPITIHLSDSGKTFRFKVGIKFNVDFHECIGCAEVWQITAVDDTKLKTLTNTYSGNKCKHCDGGNQLNTFHFKVVSAGSSVLSFKYFGQQLTVTIEGYD